MLNWRTMEDKQVGGGQAKLIPFHKLIPKEKTKKQNKKKKPRYCIVVTQ